MSRRLLGELERDPSAVGQLQRVQKAVVAIFEILIRDFELAFELDPLVRPDSRLSCGCEGRARLSGGGLLGRCRKRERHQAKDKRANHCKRTYFLIHRISSSNSPKTSWVHGYPP